MPLLAPAASFASPQRSLAPRSPAARPRLHSRQLLAGLTAVLLSVVGAPGAWAQSSLSAPIGGLVSFNLTPVDTGIPGTLGTIHEASVALPAGFGGIVHRIWPAFSIDSDFGNLDLRFSLNSRSGPQLGQVFLEGGLNAVGARVPAGGTLVVWYDTDSFFNPVAGIPLVVHAQVEPAIPNPASLSVADLLAQGAEQSVRLPANAFGRTDIVVSAPPGYGLLIRRVRAAPTNPFTLGLFAQSFGGFSVGGDTGAGVSPWFSSLSFGPGWLVMPGQTQTFRLVVDAPDLDADIILVPAAGLVL